MESPREREKREEVAREIFRDSSGLRFVGFPPRFSIFDFGLRVLGVILARCSFSRLISRIYFTFFGTNTQLFHAERHCSSLNLNNNRIIYSKVTFRTLIVDN